MSLQNELTQYGTLMGCPNTANMKRWYWSLSQQYVPETFLFPACAYYLAQDMQRTRPSIERLSFLFTEFVLNQSSPLYVNVTGGDRMKAQALVQAGIQKRQKESLQVLASCVREVGRMIDGKLHETHGITIRSHMKRYDNPTKKWTSPKWLQRLYGANKSYKVKTKARKVDSSAIDLVIDGWGNTPWLAQLRTLS